jgi:[ribosomal protein S18]-alanine N-acetyltransferase
MDKPLWSLRPATDDDISHIISVEKQIQKVPWTEENFQAELQKPYSHVLVLTDDETDLVLAGYVVFWIMLEECQILNIAIDFPFRGLGLAKFMLTRTIQIALQAGAKRAVLDVRKTNTPAIQLYQAFSFNITHVKKRYYSDGEDAYALALSFDGEILEF